MMYCGQGFEASWQYYEFLPFSTRGPLKIPLTFSLDVEFTCGCAISPRRKTILDTHLIPRFGPVLISNIPTADIQRFFTELRESGYIKSKAQRQYSSHALHDIRKVMRVVMGYANTWYRLPSDPFTGSR